jgi:lipoprotein-anchoring transpeptidase ErfK/SrfK
MERIRRRGTRVASAERAMWKITSEKNLHILLATIALVVPASAAERTFDDAALATQIRLARAGYSPGEIDGRWGRNTSGALHAFQRTHGLEATGELDDATARALGDTPVLAEHTLAPEDLDGPFAREIPEDMMERAKLETLAYTSPLEKLGELFHVDPELLVALNPQARFAAGETIQVPALSGPAPSPGYVEGAAPRAAGGEVATPAPREPHPRAPDAAEAKPHDGTAAARGERVVVVSAAESALAVIEGDRVLFWAPVTAGSEHDPLPLGEWKVTVVQRNPQFRYNPDLFWDADPAHTKALLQPGPNNPVGLVWIDLSKEHYGIHGTPEPGKIRYETSHGCVRLTNWDALRVAELVEPGTKVIFKS